MLGTLIRPAHFPGRAAITAYGNGGFRFADMSHLGALLCLPSGVYGWDPSATDRWSETDFAKVLAEADLIELILIGCGMELVPLAAPLRAAFRHAAIIAEPMSTGAAVRTYNVLLAEGRAVAAALMPVD